MTVRRTAEPSRVLVVEDEHLVAMLIEDMLHDLGYDVVAVTASLKTGMDAAGGGQFDVAVLDVNLNGEKSFPIADVLSENATPFVFASGYGVSVVREIYPDVPVVQKPFSQRSLADALMRARAN